MPMNPLQCTALAMAALPALAIATAAATPARGASSGHAIVVLVNDEPITAYEVEQRGRLLALNNGAMASYMKDNAKSRWEKIVKNPKINEEFRAYAIKRNPKSKEELQKIQQEFIRGKQKAMMEQLQSEARAHAAKGADKQAIRELVEERLKLQEAKRNNVLASDEQIGKIISGIAEKNKMNAEQFGQHLAKMGVDISTMKQRFRAMISWNDVVRRRFGYQIAISERDVDRFVDPAIAAAGADDAPANLQLKVQRVVFPVPGDLDQKAVAERLAKADQMRRKFDGCKSTAKLAKSYDAKLEDLGAKAPADIGEPVRTLLLNAKAGEMIPPNVGPEGVEVWALCERKEAPAGKAAPGAEASRGTSEKDERRQKELDLLARKHLKDLRQDASIDCRAEPKSGLCQAL